MSTIEMICERDVICAGRDTTVQAAAKLMRHYHVGSLVIVDETYGRRVPVGIVTDRDIVVEVNALDLDPNVITVGDIALPELVTVREGEGVLQTAEIMRYKGVRRLPVVNEAGDLIGIVSIDDLLEVLTEQMTEMARVLGREREQEVHARR
jgi:CBS domain-containing protein